MKGITPAEMVAAFQARILELSGGANGWLDVQPFQSNSPTDYEPTSPADAVCLVAYGGSSYLGPSRTTGLAQARLPRVVIMLGARDLSSTMAGVAYSRDRLEELTNKLSGFRVGTVRFTPQLDGYIGRGENGLHWHNAVFVGTEHGVSR